MAKNEATTPVDESAVRGAAAAEARAELKKELKSDVKASAAAKIEKELKEQMKAEIKVRIKEEVREEMREEAEAEAKKQLERDLQAEARKEARAEVSGEIRKSDKWTKDPKTRMTRVFRVLNPPMTESRVTLMQMKGQIEGTDVPGITITLKPNPAQQYVLREGAIQYEKQLVALRNHKDLEEIAPYLEGQIWIPPRTLKIRQVEAELKKLKEGGA